MCNEKKNGNFFSRCAASRAAMHEYIDSTLDAFIVRCEFYWRRSNLDNRVSGVFFLAALPALVRKVHVPSCIFLIRGCIHLLH